VAAFQEPDQADDRDVEVFARAEGDAGSAVQLIGVSGKKVDGRELGGDRERGMAQLDVDVETSFDSLRALRRNMEAGIDEAAQVQDEVALAPGVAGEQKPLVTDAVGVVGDGELRAELRADGPRVRIV